MPDPHEVPARIRDLATELAQPKAMRRGSFSQRYVKCSKPGCPCARDPKARHGPYFSLTRGLRGRTHSRFIAAAQAGTWYAVRSKPANISGARSRPSGRPASNGRTPN